MRTKILTQKEIEHAKQLRKQGKSKRQLALIFNVGSTTIWENVYSNQKRVRIYIKKEKTPCKNCEILLTREIKGNYIPLNFKIGDQCIKCFLEENNIPYNKVLNVL